MNLVERAAAWLTGAAVITVAAVCCAPADSAAVAVRAIADSFPIEYRLDRPLLAANRGALLGGDDWQSNSSTADLVGEGFRVEPNHDAATIPVVNGPPGATRAELVPDVIFGGVIRMWVTDRSDDIDHQTFFARSWQGVDRAWIRVTFRTQPGFTDGRCRQGYRGGRSHKLLFGGYQRHIQTAGDQWDVKAGPEQSWPGQSEARLPGSPNHRGKWLHGVEDGVYSGEHWYEFIAFEERLNSTSYRIRSWLRRISQRDSLIAPIQVVRANGEQAKFGIMMNAARIPPGGMKGIKLSGTRNCPLAGGEAIWHLWGPWEVIDADVLPDPYGLAHDML